MQNLLELSLDALIMDSENKNAGGRTTTTATNSYEIVKMCLGQNIFQVIFCRRITEIRTGMLKLFIEQFWIVYIWDLNFYYTLLHQAASVFWKV